MNPKQFALDVAERAAKTFFQALVGFFTAGSLITHVDWKQALVVAASAALFSVLSSVASLPIGSGDASALRSRKAAEPTGAHEAV
jgi:hypothetical protein